MIANRPGDPAKVRQIQVRRVQLPNFSNRIEPRFNMELRRNKGRYWRTVRQPNASYVTSEHRLVPMINMMVIGMPRSFDRSDLHCARLYCVAAVQHAHATFRDGRNLAP